MIRKIELNDQAAYYHLGNNLCLDFKKLFNLEKILSSKYNKIYVYLIDDIIVAFIHIQISFGTADLINLVVDKKFWRKQIATDLLNFAILENNIQEINLEVRTKNDAVMFYKKENFKTIRTIKHYYDNDDAYFMKKVIK